MREALIDGQVNTPDCRCDAECEFPCWQRVGIAPPCKACGCGTGGDEGVTDVV